jgi:hypothetical protein
MKFKCSEFLVGFGGVFDSKKPAPGFVPAPAEKFYGVHDFGRINFSFTLIQEAR